MSKHFLFSLLVVVKKQYKERKNVNRDFDEYFDVLLKIVDIFKQLSAFKLKKLSETKMKHHRKKVLQEKCDRNLNIFFVYHAYVEIPRWSMRAAV